MKTKSVILLLCGLSLASSFALAQKPHYLTIGDPAPELKPAKWIKGSPVSGFEKGQVYVVEFWATWCEPCKESIPELTALAHKEGSKASFIGVSIWETTDPANTTYLKKVSDFVHTEGDQMDYTVAADGSNAKVANDWMKPASESGIPTCFVVNQDGIIAWIGHPTQLEGVLNAVIAKQFDVPAARSQRETELQIVRPVDEALAAGHYDEALKRMDEAVAKKPSLDRFYAYYRLIAGSISIGRRRRRNRGRHYQRRQPGYRHRMVVSILATQPDLKKDAYRYGLTLDDDALNKVKWAISSWPTRSDICEYLGDKTGAAKGPGRCGSGGRKRLSRARGFCGPNEAKASETAGGSGLCKIALAPAAHAFPP